MKVIKLVLAIFLCSAAIGYAQSDADIGGTWLGTLDTGALKLRIGFDISGRASRNFHQRHESFRRNCLERELRGIC
jgi:hypothetical protein